jgi:tungsten cofactor oxidoreducase radical SAM maturase
MLQKVYLELTDGCNLECEICYRHQWSEKPVDLTENLWRKIANQISADDSIKTIVLGGMGEPLMSPMFEKTVDLLKHKEICVTTNATLFREKLTKELVEKIHLFVVSIDGMEQHMIKGRGVVFSQLMENVDYLNQLKSSSEKNGLPHLDIQFVASRKNIGDIFPLMDVLSEKNIRNLIISHLLPQNEEQAADILYARYENKEAKELFHKIRNHSFKRGLRVVFPEVSLKTERRCAFVSNNATYITSRGLVVPCYRLSHPGKEIVFGRPKTLRQYSFGDLNATTLKEIWNDPVYAGFREKIYNNHYPSCPDCDLVDGCSLIHDVDFDCHGEEPNCADCLWARRFVFC